MVNTNVNELKKEWAELRDEFRKWRFRAIVLMAIQFTVRIEFSKGDARQMLWFVVPVCIATAFYYVRTRAVWKQLEEQNAYSALADRCA